MVCPRWRECKGIRFTNELLRDLIEPSFTLWTFYFTFGLYVLEFVLCTLKILNNDIAWLLSWLAMGLLYILSYYLLMYTLNAHSAENRVFRKAKSMLENDDHDFHAFLWKVFTLQTPGFMKQHQYIKGQYYVILIVADFLVAGLELILWIITWITWKR